VHAGKKRRVQSNAGQASLTWSSAVTFCLSSSPGRRKFGRMARTFLVLIGVIAVVMAALFVSAYILDWVKAPEVWQDARKIFSLLGVATVTGLIILFLVKAGEKK
jgi:hypothetical protein